MIRKKIGFTLIEVLIVLALFSSVSVVIFSVFMSNHMRIEAQGKETFLHEEVDRGLTRLTDRMRGTNEVVERKASDNSDVLFRFNYYYRDNDKIIEGKLYRELVDGKYKLRLESTKDGVVTDSFIMGYIDSFEIIRIDGNGDVTTDKDLVRSVKVKYTISTKFRKIKKEKSGETTIRLRNIGA